MSILESLFVSVFGMAVVFIVLIGLSLLVRLQSALFTRFTQKKPAAALIQETPAAIAPAPAEAADTSAKRTGDDQGAAPRDARPVHHGYSGAAVKISGGGEIKKKYVASVNGKVYEAEVEEVNAPLSQDTVS